MTMTKTRTGRHLVFMDTLNTFAFLLDCELHIEVGVGIQREKWIKLLKSTARAHHASYQFSFQSLGFDLAATRRSEGSW